MILLGCLNEGNGEEYEKKNRKIISDFIGGYICHGSDICMSQEG